MTEARTAWQTGTVNANGIHLFYESAGPVSAPAVVLVAGLGCQVTMWPEVFCLHLLECGFRVIRFDNRDIGLSSEVNRHVKVSMPVAFLKAKLGLPIASNYTLMDMADDLIGLLDALQLPSAHVVGISMGGMISQIAAAKHPQRIASLSLIMTSTNHPSLPGPDAKVLHKMFLKRPRDASVDAFCDHIEGVFSAIGSPDYPTPRQELRAAAQHSYHRSRRPAGVMRQTNAVVATGSIEEFTRRISTPSLVIHGAKDPLLKPACGKRVAKLIPGAHLELIEGMGHDLPDALCPKLARLIALHCERNKNGAQGPVAA